MKTPLNRILMVEDDCDIQTVARLALESIEGYSLAVASSGREALNAVTDFAPDLILLDVVLPGMDGPATLRALRDDPAAHCTPVIFLTANAQPAEIERYKNMGALGVIAKPFDPMSLAATIRRIWDHADA